MERLAKSKMGRLLQRGSQSLLGDIYENGTNKLIARSIKMLPSELEQERLAIIFTYRDELFCCTSNGFDNEMAKVIKNLCSNYCMVKALGRFNSLNVLYKKDSLTLLTAYSRNPQINLEYKSLCLMAQILKMPIVAENTFRKIK